MRGKITSDPIKIRPLYKDDLSEIVAIEAEAFPGRPWTLDEWNAVIESGQFVCTVCEWYGTLVGYIVTAPRTTRGLVRIANLAVEREHRRQGIGSLLLSEVVKREEGKSAVLAALVRETNVIGAKFFCFAGFKATLATKPYDDHDEDGFEFRFALPTVSRQLPLRRVAR